MFFSYVVTRDFGFAPNPFGGICTLATCKQTIRNKAEKEDWIFGFGSSALNCTGKLIFAMKVTNKIKYNEYYGRSEFNLKKAVMNGSLKRMYGDNIYHFDKNKGSWNQRNSHHSNEDGSINYLNLNRDTKSEYVLLSDHYYYWGKNLINIPDEYKSIIHTGRGHSSRRIDSNIALSFINWISNNFDQGYLGDPIQFDNIFQRYDGR